MVNVYYGKSMNPHLCLGGNTLITKRKLHYIFLFLKINIIVVSTELKLFATGCEGGYVNLYNIYTGKFFRTFRHRDQFPINAIVLSGRPLCCIVI